jgi:N-acetylmuramoyl-L-alanine amidase
VLKAPDVPSVLVELGYISNPREERLLVTRKHRQELSAAIVEAVDEYFKTTQSAAL